MEPVELMGKAAAVAVTAALCGAVLRRGAPELALLLSLAAGVWILLAAWDGLRETARLMEELALLAGLDRGVVEPVLKTVVLSVVTRLTSEVCRSAGEGGIASFVETAGKSEAVSGRTYRAKAGESLWDYAYFTGVSIDRLAENNRHITCIAALKDGEEVHVP